MYPDNSSLFVQTGAVSKRKPQYSGSKENISLLKEFPGVNKDETKSQLHFYFSEKIDLLRKLEHRIQTLEPQEDHLLHFIHQLLEQFTEWVRDILSTNRSSITEKENKMCSFNPGGKKGRVPEPIRKEIPSITKREMDVLNLLVKGLCAKEIAHILFISETTVITHKKHLKQKFNARNSVELISKAIIAYG